MAAGAKDFSDALSGATWTQSLTWGRKVDGGPVEPYDLTGTYAVFRLTKDSDVMDGGAVISDAAGGRIDLLLTDNQTDAMVGKWLYTVAVVFGPDDVRPVLNGRFTVTRSALVPVL